MRSRRVPAVRWLGQREEAVSHGGATMDLLRTVLGDDMLHPQLLKAVPACAITALDDLDVIEIASTAHLS